MIRQQGGRFWRPVSVSLCLGFFCFASAGNASRSTNSIHPDRLLWGGDTATIVVQGTEEKEELACSFLPRTYVLKTTARLRDGVPASKQVTFLEDTNGMALRSGHDLFDGMFALALEESRQAVAPGGKLQDPSYNGGLAMDCNCFLTGEKWNYVWTRDTAYGVDLGLATINPQVSRRSLEFKLSSKRGAISPKLSTGPEIVQDTGSGGSWPISTDRVAWALGAAELLKFLDGKERADFVSRAYPAITNTIETDRLAIFDTRDGLYRGETSFLDWREQTYSSWTRDDTVHVGMSKALSTNLVQYRILKAAADLAGDKGLSAAKLKYGQWADALAVAINREFWLPEDGLYASYKSTELSPIAVRKFDLLGQSLAVVMGVASADRAKSILEKYPHVAAGAPVIWPQLPDVAIYHNRGIWPFVTAYWMQSARIAGNEAVFNDALETLMRGAALNLSNMENFEFLTLSSAYEDGGLSGPVVNSRRQLWSVGGYWAAVAKGIFGLESTNEGIRFQPFVTRHLRNKIFASSNELVLKRFPYRGKLVDIEVRLPKVNAEASGCLRASQIALNGVDVGDRFLAPSDLKATNRLVIDLAPSACGSSTETRVAVRDPRALTRPEYEAIYAPREPWLGQISDVAGYPHLEFHANGERNVTFNVYRNGKRVASQVEKSPWIDAEHFDAKTLRPSCYVVESVFTSSGNASHHAKPACFWPTGSIAVFTATDGRLKTMDDGTLVQDGVAHFGGWGKPGQVLETVEFTVPVSGDYFVEPIYAHGGRINTGVTAGVKWVGVLEGSSTKSTGGGMLSMPHGGRWDRWMGGNFVRFSLVAGQRYRFRIEDFFNMSYLAHFASYTGARLDLSQPVNRVNLHGIKLLRAF